MKGRRLAAFVGRRVVALAVLLLILSFVSFSLLYLSPGSPERVLLGTRPASPELLHALRVQFHLDKSFLEQYRLWLVSALHFDFGESVRTGRSVTAMISGQLGVTAFLTAYAFVVAVGAGLPLGVLAAVRKRRASDRGIVGLAVLGVSAPSFVTGVVLLYFLAVRLGWFPTYGPGSGFADRFWHLTLPALALALTAMALVVKLTRTAMVNALEQDYVAFALARGVPMHRVLWRYALRNALVPIVTAAGSVVTIVLTGTILVETTFSLPGLGTLLVSAVQDKDLPVLQAVSLLLAALIVLVNLAVDVLYTVVDPRIEFGKGRA
ncbi:MAG TPA: ABC transporter permease [Conexibacter sp.]|jgi:peptide/nickel transport system permease protein|nr:ABC transporter permease [Conexibacter sp.]